jgi:hypothetical protein
MKKYLDLATAASVALSAGSFANAQNYTQVNLVANTAGVAPLTAQCSGCSWPARSFVPAELLV